LPVLSELKRRNVFKVAAAYAVVSWLLLQIADVLLPALQLPAWTITLVAVLLVLGFPIALVLSWAYDIGPGGVQRTEAAPAAVDQPRGPSRTVDFAIIVALSIALAFVVFNYVLVDEGAAPGIPADAASVVPTATETVSLTAENSPDVLPNSIAVLPLENLSPDPENAFFAAGMQSEILAYLRKLRNLNVISRTSVEKYVASNLTLPEIARELKVAHVMEGDARFAGDRVRVTLQLVNAQTDATVWSEVYDDDLSDVFAIQTDIAMNVANALQAEFSLAEQQSIEKAPTRSEAAYTLYLRADNTRWPNDSVLEDLDRATELDPEYSDAYALKALYMAVTAPPTNETERFVVENADKALSLDPTAARPHLALALLRQGRWEGSEALASLQSAYELAPNDVEVLILFAQFNRYIGNVAEALEANQRAAELDPNSSRSYSQLGASLRYSEMYAEAEVAYERAIALAETNIGNRTQFAMLQALRDRPEAALRELARAEELLTPNDVIRRAQMAGAYARIGRIEDAQRIFDELVAIDRERPLHDALWATAYLAIGDYDEAERRLRNAIDNQLPAGQIPYGDGRIYFSNIKNNTMDAAALEEPRFVALRERIFAFN